MVFHLEVAQFGDLDAPPLGTSDPDLLLWAESNDCVLISRDAKTLPAHLKAHVAADRCSPGVLLARGISLNEMAEYLVMLAFAGDPDDLSNRIAFIP